MKGTNFNIKINRQTHQIDATGQILGRLATHIANLLRGKLKPDFTAHLDNGDFVVVSHPQLIKLSGKKLEQKKMYTHSGYPGGLKTKKLSQEMAINPEKVIRLAVSKMLPKTKWRTIILKRLSFKK